MNEDGSAVDVRKSFLTVSHILKPLGCEGRWGRAHPQGWELLRLMLRNRVSGSLPTGWPYPLFPSVQMASTSRVSIYYTKERRRQLVRGPVLKSQSVSDSTGLERAQVVTRHHQTQACDLIKSFKSQMSSFSSVQWRCYQPI